MIKPAIMSSINCRRRESVNGLATFLTKLYSLRRISFGNPLPAIFAPPFACSAVNPCDGRLFCFLCQADVTGGTPRVKFLDSERSLWTIKAVECFYAHDHSRCFKMSESPKAR